MRLILIIQYLKGLKIFFYLYYLYKINFHLNFKTRISTCLRRASEKNPIKKATALGCRSEILKTYRYIDLIREINYNVLKGIENVFDSCSFIDLQN